MLSAATHTELGMPRGMFATIPNHLFHDGLLKARLWLISCIASVMLWLISPPTQYDRSTTQGQDRSWTIQHMVTCVSTATATFHFNKGSGPNNDRTSAQ